MKFQPPTAKASLARETAIEWNLTRPMSDNGFTGFKGSLAIQVTGVPTTPPVIGIMYTTPCWSAAASHVPLGCTATVSQ